MPFSLGDAFITIRPQLASGFENALGTALGSAISNVSDTVERAGRTLTSKLTVPIAIGTAANVTQFAQLDAKLRETATLFSAVGDRADRFLGEFNDGLSEVTDSVGLFEQNVAQGLYQAISAGIPRGNVFEFLEVASKAAVGGALDVEIAVNGLTTAVNAFSAEGLTAERAADILFRGVARGKTTFEELSSEMATAAPLAAQAGVSFAEFVAVLATMTLSGTTTAEAVTQTRAALTGLLRPSEELTLIMQQAGYETQAAAVQSLGMQGALELLVDATEGEVGALISLLGGAEAANAALQITGENASTFDSILRDTTNSTGALESAFRTMDESASRTFGRLFAQIDRLGSNFGEFGAEILAPAAAGLESVVSAVNRLVEGFMEAPPVIRQLVTSFVYLAAAIGPLLVLSSRLMTLFGIQMGAMLAKNARLIPSVVTGFRLLAGSAALMLTQITGLIPFLESFTLKLRGLGLRVLKPVIDDMGNVAHSVGAVSLAVVGGIAAWQLYNDWAKRVEDSQRVLRVGTEKLADSLGLVVKPAAELARVGEADIRFRVENADLLKELADIREETPELFESTLVRIGWQLVNLGNTPEEAFGAIQQLADEMGVDLPVTITMEDFGDIDQIQRGILAQTKTLGDELDTIMTNAALSSTTAFSGISSMIANVLSGGELSKARGTIKGLGDEVASLFQTDMAKGLETLEEIERSFGDNTDAIDIFGEAFLDAIDVNDDLNITNGGLQDTENIIRQLTDAGVLFSGELGDIGREGVDAAGNVDELALAVGGLGQQKATITDVEEAFSHMNDVMADIKQSFTDTFNEIKERLMGELPLWGEYEGAVELSISEIMGSLDQYNADLQAWSDLNKELAGEIPDELRDQLNEMPLEQRAALARLAEEAPEQFDALIAKYEESFGITETVADETFNAELPRLLREGRLKMIEELERTKERLGEMGGGAALAWKTSFEKIAVGWDEMVGGYASQAARAMRRKLEIESPSKVFMAIGELTARGFELGLQGRSNQTEASARQLATAALGGITGGLAPVQQSRTEQRYEFNIYNPRTEDIDRSAQRTLQYARLQGAL